MIEELRINIDNLSGSETKTLLFNTILRLQVIIESNSSQEQKFEELHALYKELTEIPQYRKEIHRDYKAIHMVCGDSPAGGIRIGLGHEHRVIGLPNFFGMGPVFELHKQGGQNNHFEWLKDRINIPMDYIEDEYEFRFRNTLEQIRTIPENVPIVLWTAENAGEQTGIRFCLEILKNKANEVFVINTSIAYQELFNTEEVQYFLHHTGEAHPDKLRAIYQQKCTNPLTAQERFDLQKEWLELSETGEVLRIWENGKIQSVSEDYYDNELIGTAKKLHIKQGKNGFVKSSRIIGELYGQLEGDVDDAFLEYRLRCLIYDGVFEIKGIPKGMRYYSVRLK